ncbi:hypothetical protein KIN20_024054 [Parelaphostrongylus tenuis]|uniref:Uncharacterized protein n=1 Tax=Parelaphostrongylus tenuis TaxID=148309 RepID=A0AAD5QW41_PARTN|nr:hypothetical protein KIN20_024054 [Parelaphostrongylus tenuis]
MKQKSGSENDETGCGAEWRMVKIRGFTVSCKLPMIGTQTHGAVDGERRNVFDRDDEQHEANALTLTNVQTSANISKLLRMGRRRTKQQLNSHLSDANGAMKEANWQLTLITSKQARTRIQTSTSTSLGNEKTYNMSIKDISGNIFQRTTKKCHC